MLTREIVHEGNPRLHYYNNTLDYYTLNNNNGKPTSKLFNNFAHSYGNIVYNSYKRDGCSFGAK
jgi:hypothetical protein